MKIEITKIDLLKVSARLALIQSAWTMTSMQSEGFVFCLVPVLKKLFPDGQKLRRVVNHYHMPINTHPFLVSILAGSILRMEAEHQSQRLIVSFLKNSMSALAALGDSFFHAILAFSTVVAALVTLLWGSVAGIVTLLVMYNSVHLTIRLSGIFIGFKKGDSTIADLGRWIDSDKTKLLRTLTGVVGGFLLSMVFYQRLGTAFPTIWVLPIACVTIAFAFVLNLKRAVWVYVLPAFLLFTLILEVVI